MKKKINQGLAWYPLLGRASRRIRLMLRGAEEARIGTDEALRSSSERLARQARPADREEGDEPRRQDGA